MAQFSAWLAGLFSSAPTRGLSGDDRKLDAAGVPGTFFHARLHRHESEGDFVENPALLWSTRGYDGRKYGLREHLAEQRGEGDTAQFTDVLVILNERDHRQSLERLAEPWSDAATRALHREFLSYCDDESFQILRTSRPVRFGLVVDGGSEIGGLKFGLKSGEFVTGLLPNFYTGPIATSRPVIGVHLNIPGAWEGYREVGTLFSDQLMFTIGNHGLDSFRHPALVEPGLYRLQQYLDGSFVHIVTPDGESDYHVSSDEDGAGPSVLTIAQADGAPVAYLVLAVLDHTVYDTSNVRPDPDPPVQVVIEESMTVDRSPDILTPRPVIEPPAPPPRQRDSQPQQSMPLTGHLTIVPDAVRERIFSLRERGALLQKVHFSRFMMGYDVFVTRTGQISTSTRSPSAVFQVRGRKVRLLVHDPELRLNGHPAELEKPLDLGAAAMIEVAGAPLEYRDLSGVTAEGWPYLGEIRRPTGSTHMVFGGRYRVGRDRRCKVRLPDDPHNGNIHWDPSRISGGTIRTRSGEVPQSRFYTDSIMVASEHAEVDLRDAPVLQNIARHCFTYVRRGADLFPLSPTQSKNEGPRELELTPGDEVLVGNCLFQVSYPPDKPREKISMTPSILAGAADTRAANEADAVPELDVPAAAGLGEHGAPPEPPPPFHGIASYDSIIVEGAIRDAPAAAAPVHRGLQLRLPHRRPRGAARSARRPRARRPDGHRRDPGLPPGGGRVAPAPARAAPADAPTSGAPAPGAPSPDAPAPDAVRRPRGRSLRGRGRVDGRAGPPRPAGAGGLDARRRRHRGQPPGRPGGHP